jgi:serine/threonine protein kinase
MSASTWLAEAADSGETPGKAVLKILDLKDASSWNVVDVFKREAEALQSLSHPGIPAYFDSLEHESEGSLLLVLAMEYIEGENLERIVKSGRRFSEPEIQDLLARLADILAYLGSLRPPVVHRDVNPRNIIRKPDGSIALVDFSGVQDAVRTSLFPGATLVGTAGYVPLEQVAGRASHRSDLYGAAATTLFLLSGRNPAELPLRGLKTDISGLVALSPALAAVLDSWLEPDVDRRSLSATDAAAMLRGRKRPGRPAAAAAAGTAPGEGAATDLIPDAVRLSTFDLPLVHPLQHSGQQPRPDPVPADSGPPLPLPADSRVVMEESDGRLLVKIPRPGFKGSAMPGMTFAVSWIGFVAFWTFMVIRMRAPMFFPMFSIPFWAVGIFMARTMLGPVFTKQELRLGPEGLLISSEIFGFERRSLWPLSDLGQAKVVPSRLQVNNIPAKELQIEAGTRHLLVGAGLSERELRSIEKAFGSMLAELRRSPPENR